MLHPTVAFPDILQWPHDGRHLGLTAAGTAPDFHRIPFSRLRGEGKLIRRVSFLSESILILRPAAKMFILVPLKF